MEVSSFFIMYFEAKICFRSSEVSVAQRCAIMEVSKIYRHQS